MINPMLNLSSNQVVELMKSALDEVAEPGISQKNLEASDVHIAAENLDIKQVNIIANELFDGDSTRFAELLHGVDMKFRRLQALEALCAEMVTRSPGGCYFLPWAERLATLGIKRSK